MQSSENGAESTIGLVESDQHVLNFLDSMDNYLTLIDSLSSSLRQGWLDLAGARHSMGTFRVNSTLFDLKSHHASSTLQLQEDGGLDEKEPPSPSFALCKWANSGDPEKCSKFEEDELLHDDNNSNSPRVQDKELDRTGSSGSPVTHDDDQAQKERSKSLSMFGTLVSPKLRATQLSFEKSLEVLVEIANERASLLRAYEQVQKDMKTDK